jgi:hypothetical protein
MRLAAFLCLLAFLQADALAQRAIDMGNPMPRQLVILVRFDTAGQASQRELGASGRISNRGSELEVRAQDSRSQTEERVDQRVMVLEGGRATLFVGQSRPIAQQQVIQTPAGTIGQRTIVVQQSGTGIEVSPRLSGERVFLEVGAQSDRMDSRGNVEGQRLATSVMGRLGEWFEISGAVEGMSRDDRGIASAAQARSSGSRRIFVKVDELGRESGKGIGN